MSSRHFSNVIGFDDAPFPSDYHGPVQVVGAVFTRLQLSGVVIGRVQKDGSDAAENLTRLVRQSRFGEHVQLVLLQGIALAGFNVVDVFSLHRALNLPVLVVSRRRPDLMAVRRALLTQVPGGAEKWAIIERLGPMEEVVNIHVQRVGLSLDQARQVIDLFAVHSHIPEPLRTAHLIAGALTNGQSRGRP